MGRAEEYGRLLINGRVTVRTKRMEEMVNGYGSF